MSTRKVLDFTVTDLLGGGDDVQRLVTADDPDELWNQVVRWPRNRLTAALVAAVGAIQGDDSDETADGHGHHSPTTGHCESGRDIERTPPDGH